jgi:hypothetical protein
MTVTMELFKSLQKPTKKRNEVQAKSIKNNGIMVLVSSIFLNNKKQYTLANFNIIRIQKI